MSDEIEMPALRRFLVALGTAFPLVGTQSTHSRLSTDEFVMFLPDIAYQNADGEIVAGVQAWVYEKEKRRGLTHMLAIFLGVDISSLSQKQRNQLYARTQLFRVDSEGGKELLLCDESGKIFTMPKTANNGRSYVLVPISLHNSAYITAINFNVINSGAPENMDKATAIYAPPHGVSIISDIDDTIKISAVGDKKQLLRNTFLEDFSAVAGMAELYQKINKDKTIAYHYVSSSPIQLYPVLSEFLKKQGFPLGSMHLREATRWTDIVPLKNTSRSHKKNSISRILTAYPKRKFILIGDSTENDPALYAELKEHFKEQISAIIIRHINPRKSIEDLAKYFANFDKTNWLITEEVAKMHQFIHRFI